MGTENQNYDREFGSIETKLQYLERQIENNKNDFNKSLDKVEIKTENKISGLENKIDRELKEINDKLDNKLKEIIDKLDDQNTTIETKFKEQSTSISNIEQDKHFSKGFIKAITVIFAITVALAGVYLKMK